MNTKDPAAKQTYVLHANGSVTLTPVTRTAADGASTGSVVVGG